MDENRNSAYLLTCSVYENTGAGGGGFVKQLAPDYLSASVAEWLRAWDTLATMKQWRREVVSSIPDRGTIAGRFFSPTRQLVRFSHLNMPSFEKF